jgi:hypothetical protein
VASIALKRVHNRTRSYEAIAVSLIEWQLAHLHERSIVCHQRTRTTDPVELLNLHDFTLTELRLTEKPTSTYSDSATGLMQFAYRNDGETCRCLLNQCIQ